MRMLEDSVKLHCWCAAPERERLMFAVREAAN